MSASVFNAITERLRAKHQHEEVGVRKAKVFLKVWINHHGGIFAVPNWNRMKEYVPFRIVQIGVQYDKGQST